MWGGKGERGEERGRRTARGLFYNPAPHTTLCMQPAAPPLGAQGWRSYSTALLVTVFAVIAASVTLLKEGSELHNLCPPPRRLPLSGLLGAPRKPDPLRDTTCAARRPAKGC